MMKRFMTDIETVGVDEREGDILQVGMLRIDLKTHGLYEAEEEFEVTLPSPAKPNDWALNNGQAELYKQCNALYDGMSQEEHASFPNWCYNDLRQRILKFWDECGCKDRWDIQVIGRNVEGFDLKWLRHKMILGKDDTHYRVYDFTSALQAMQDITGLDRYVLQRVADLVGWLNKWPDKGGEHQALYDCFDQTRKLNGLITLGRDGVHAHKDAVEAAEAQIDEEMEAKKGKS